MKYQDNKSAISLEVNGKWLTSKQTKQTKQIKVRYFFIKDKVESGETVVKYCQKERMWANVSTKLLQGIEYETFQRKLMNVLAENNNNNKPFAMDNYPIKKRVAFKQGTKLGSPHIITGRNRNKFILQINCRSVLVDTTS